jgi:diguanylate cyclase (GGDEF)-like protein/PAS domain S-box-containing protein
MTDFFALNSKKLLEHAHLGVIIHRWDTSIIYANPTALRLLGLTYKQIIGKDDFDPQWNFLNDAGKKLLVEDYPVNKVKRTQKRLKNEVIGVIDISKNKISWFFINAYYEGEPETSESFIVVTFTDITDSKELFSFEDIVENAKDVIIVTEAENIKHPTGPKIVYVNRAFEELTGYSKEHALGETPRILQGTLTNKESTDRIHEALQSNQSINETLLNYDVKGRPYWIEMNIIPLINKYGDVTHFAAIERDVSERKFHLEQLKKRNHDLKVLKRDLERLVEVRTLELQKAKATLEKIAFFDPLTNIPNRRFFIDQSNRLIKSCSRRNLMIAFGIIDIDDFKLLNDTHGHDVGDAVLVKLSTYLKQFFRSDDAICRHGGEEFAFTVAIEKASDLKRLADRLMTGIRNIDIEMDTKEHLSMTVSIGIKLCNPSSDHDLEIQIKQADIALYQSKENGKNKFTIVSDN